MRPPRSWVPGRGGAAVSALVTAGALLLTAIRVAPAQGQGLDPDDLPAAAIVVIANADVDPGRGSLTTAELRRIFMLRRRFWADGRRIAPVNLPASDSIRDRFSRAILGQSPRDLADYWNDLYFHGVEPPPVMESQQAVQLYVARTPGAVGYVTAGALDPGVPGLRTLMVILVPGYGGRGERQPGGDGGLGEIPTAGRVTSG